MTTAFLKSSFDSVCKLPRLLGGKIFGVTATNSVPSTSCCVNNATTTSISSAPNFAIPARAKHFDHHFLNRWMARDYKRRMLVKERYPERLRMVAMKRCVALPREFQETVSQELHAFPRDSCYVRIKPRCILSSRARWVLHKYRVSRIHYRLLADYNKLSGTHRGTW